MCPSSIKFGITRSRGLLVRWKGDGIENTRRLEALDGCRVTDSWPKQRGNTWRTSTRISEAELSRVVEQRRRHVCGIWPPRSWHRDLLQINSVNMRQPSDFVSSVDKGYNSGVKSDKSFGKHGQWSATVYLCVCLQ